MRRTDSAIATLKRDIEDLERHRDALRQELDRSRQLVGVDLRELAAAFPALRTLFVALHWVHVAADPLSSKEIDGQLVMTSGEPPDEGAATRAARQRLRRVNGQVERLAERIEIEISGEAVKVEHPRCWRRQCERYGKRIQDLTAKHCPACGERLPGKEDGDE